MFGILVVSHDELAGELVRAARNIVGRDLISVAAVSIGWEQDMDLARTRISAALKEVSGTGSAIILTDMFGGTPTNISLTFLHPGTVEVLTGVNLPMLIKLVSLQKLDVDIDKAARIARDRGRQTILIASEVLGGAETQESDTGEKETE
jgi:PTS system mannose-specific IIA component